VSAAVEQDPLQLGDPGLGGARHRLRFRYSTLHCPRCPTPLRLQLFGLVLLKRTNCRSGLTELLLFRSALGLLDVSVPRKRFLFLLLSRRVRRFLGLLLGQLAVALRFLTLRVDLAEQ
jgi:hypothetical protein